MSESDPLRRAEELADRVAAAVAGLPRFPPPDAPRLRTLLRRAQEHLLLAGDRPEAEEVRRRLLHLRELLQAWQEWDASKSRLSFAQWAAQHARPDRVSS